MDRRIITALAVLLVSLVVVQAVSWDSAAPGESGTATPGTPEPAGPPEITEDSVVSASGGCGSDATWSYSRSADTSSMTVSGGTVKPLSRSSSVWGDWTLDKLTVDGTEITGADLKQYSPSEVFKQTMRLHLTGSGVSAADEAFRGLGVTAVTFGDSVTSISGGLLAGCVSLSSVEIGDGIVSIGKEAFRDCRSLSSIDLRKATVDPSAFKGCSKLISFKATGSTHYTVAEARPWALMSDGGRTLHICATGYTGESGTGVVHPVTALPGVSSINLDFAGITYIVDEVNGGSGITFKEDAVEDGTARALVYSSLGMSEHKLTLSVGVLTLTYKLYPGWTVDDSCMVAADVTVNGSASTFRLTVEKGRAATFYPMGIDTLTYGDLKAITRVGDWRVSLSEVPQGSENDVITSIGEIGLTVTGYEGSSESARLGGEILYHGITCDVREIRMDSTRMGGLKHLEILEGVEISDYAFENCSGLESVTADHAASVGKGAFRFCTLLHSITLGSCTGIGDYAFDSCWTLERVTVNGSRSLAVGDGAFSGCRDLGMIEVGYDTEVTGSTAGVPVVHFTSNEFEYAMEVVGDFLMVYGQFQYELYYSTERGGDEVTIQYYAGGGPLEGPQTRTAIVPLADEMFIRSQSGQGSTGATVLVVFDPGYGLEYSSEEVRYNGTVAGVPSPTMWGYEFRYWVGPDGMPFDAGRPLTDSVVLTAMWAKENPIDSTPIYLMGIFGASIVATFAVLAVGRRMR